MRGKVISPVPIREEFAVTVKGQHQERERVGIKEEHDEADEPQAFAEQRLKVAGEVRAGCRCQDRLQLFERGGFRALLCRIRRLGVHGGPEPWRWRQHASKPALLQAQEPRQVFFRSRLFTRQATIIDFQREQCAKQGGTLRLRHRGEIVLEARTLPSPPGCFEAVALPLPAPDLGALPAVGVWAPGSTHGSTSSPHSSRIACSLRSTVRGTQSSRAAISSTV